MAFRPSDAAAAMSSLMHQVGSTARRRHMGQDISGTGRRGGPRQDTVRLRHEPWATPTSRGVVPQLEESGKVRQVTEQPLCLLEQAAPWHLRWHFLEGQLPGPGSAHGPHSRFGWVEK